MSGSTIDPATLNVRGRVEIVSFPERLVARLGAKQGGHRQDCSRAVYRSASAILQRLVEQRGLRAQLRSGNLLTGQLFVAFDLLPERAQGEDRLEQRRAGAAGGPEHRFRPRGEAHQHRRQARQAAARRDRRRRDKGARHLDQTLKDASKAVNRIDTDVTPGLKTTLEDLRGTIATVDRVLKNTDATLVGKDAPAQQDLRDALQEITRAARSLRVLTDYLERHPESLIRGKTEENP